MNFKLCYAIPVWKLAMHTYFCKVFVSVWAYFSIKVKVSVLYLIELGTESTQVFCDKSFKEWKRFKFLHIQRTANTNNSAGILCIGKNSTTFGIGKIDAHTKISGPSALWCLKQSNHIIPFIHSSIPEWKTNCLASTVPTQDFQLLFQKLSFFLKFYPKFINSRLLI